MPITGPEIAVRLSAQGVQDVVNAFARVRQEGKKTGTETGGAFSALTGQLGSLAALVPTLSAGLAAMTLGKLVLEARETAENIGKLSEKTGGSVGTLSALALSAHDSEVSFEDLSKGMVKLAKAQSAAVSGNKDQKKAFADVGVSIQDLQAMNPADLFAKIGKNIAALPPGAQRTADTLRIFGKAGAELIPMLDALGTDGFDKALEKAKKLGLYMDDDMVNSSRAAQDALHELEDVAAGLATRFNAGFMPGFTAGVEVLAEEVEGHGVDSMKKFGESVGDFVAHYVAGFTIIFEWTKTVLSFIATESKKVFGVISAFDTAYNENGMSFSAGFKAAKSYLQGTKSSFAQDAAETWKTLASTRPRVLGTLDKAQEENRKRKPNSYPKGRGADGDGENEEDKKKAVDEAAKRAKALSDMMQARADNEIAIQRVTAQVEEADDKRKYDAGLLSLDEYYDRREQRITAAADAERDALFAKYAAAENLPQQTEEQRLKRQQELDKITAQAAELDIKREGDLKQVEDERAKGKLDNTEKQLALEGQLDGRIGNRVEAERAALQASLTNYKQLLTTEAKLSENDIKAAVERYRILGNAKINFEENQRQAGVASGDLNRGVQGVRTRQGSGAISEISATAEMLRLQNQQLPVLRAIGDQMLQNALDADDPEMLAQVEDYIAGLDEMQAHMRNVKSATTELTDQLTSTGQNALTDFFADGISGAKSFGDAMGDLASTVEKMVGRMIAQLLTFYLLEAVVGFVAPGSDFATSLAASGPFGKGFDEGGWTGGTRGKAAGIVHGEEFVVKAGPAAQHRAMLEDINAGLRPARVATAADYATPMPSAEDASPQVNVGSPIINITTPANTQTQTTQRTGQGGQSITDIIITAVSTDIARGGQIAKTIQGTYGTTRQGRATG